MINGVVKGVLPSMKNSRRIVKNMATGKTMIIKAQNALDYETVFMLQVRKIPKPILDEVTLYLDIYYPDRRRDVDGELFCDLLQKRGILNNDRQIRRKVFTKYFDKQNPRVEWQIERFEDDGK